MLPSPNEARVVVFVEQDEPLVIFHPITAHALHRREEFGFAAHLLGRPGAAGNAEGRKPDLSGCVDRIRTAIRVDAGRARDFPIGGEFQRNARVGRNLAGAAEALALAVKLGLDPARTLDVIEQSSGQSWIGGDRLRRAIAGDYAPRAHVTLLHKDTRLALEAARSAGFEGPLGPAAHGVFDAAVAAGMGGLDDAALFALLARLHIPQAPSS